MMAALGGELAYAECNISVTPSGKIVIGDEFRGELRTTYSDEQIDAALDCTLAAMPGEPQQTGDPRPDPAAVRLSPAGCGQDAQTQIYETVEVVTMSTVTEKTATLQPLVVTVGETLFICAGRPAAATSSMPVARSSYSTVKGLRATRSQFLR